MSVCMYNSESIIVLQGRVWPLLSPVDLLIFFIGVLCHFQHCIGNIRMFNGQRKSVHTVGVKVLYCKLLTNGKQLPTFQHKVRGLNHRPQRWEVSVLQLLQLVSRFCTVNC